MAKASDPHWEREQDATSRGYRAIAGLDEAGRGALAGPVVAAAVVLDLGRCPEGVRDSKILSTTQREALYDAILACARCWGTGVARAEEIDARGIVTATRWAMRRAIEAMPQPPDYLIIDALALPGIGIPFEAPIKADRDVISVSAASILAKVTRDRLLQGLDTVHIGYGFAVHKGYGTRAHLEAIASLGPSPEHRMTFAGVAQMRLWGDIRLGGTGGSEGGRTRRYPKPDRARKLQ